MVFEKRIKQKLFSPESKNVLPRFQTGMNTKAKMQERTRFSSFTMQVA